MSDLLGAAAARAQQKRAERKDSAITMENNALVRLIEERAEEKDARARAEEAWMQEIQDALESVAAAGTRCGRHVEDISYNGEVVFIRRKSEAIRLLVGKIRNQRDLQYAAMRVMSAIMGC